MDIDSFIRAKAAIFSAINISFPALDMDVTSAHVYVAGGIGSASTWKTPCASACCRISTGDLPEYLGNTSLSGAYAMVRSDCAVNKVDELASNMTYMELSTNPRYMDEFVAACFPAAHQPGAVPVEHSGVNFLCRYRTTGRSPVCPL